MFHVLELQQRSKTELTAFFVVVVVVLFLVAIDGGYTEWSESECSVTCGEGTKILTRTCTNPSPSCGGKNCSELGPDLTTIPCDEGECRKYFNRHFKSPMVEQFD